MVHGWLLSCGDWLTWQWRWLDDLQHGQAPDLMARMAIFHAADQAPGAVLSWALEKALAEAGLAINHGYPQTKDRQ